MGIAYDAMGEMKKDSVSEKISETDEEYSVVRLNFYSDKLFALPFEEDPKE